VHLQFHELQFLHQTPGVIALLVGISLALIFAGSARGAGDRKRLRGCTTLLVVFALFLAPVALASSSLSVTVASDAASADFAFSGATTEDYLYVWDHTETPNTGAWNYATPVCGTGANTSCSHWPIYATDVAGHGNADGVLTWELCDSSSAFATCSNPVTTDWVEATPSFGTPTPTPPPITQERFLGWIVGGIIFLSTVPIWREIMR